MPNKKDPFEAIRIVEFRNLMIGRFLFIMGLRMMGTLVGWWVYEITKDPFAIGLIGLAEVVPAVSLSLYAGHIIDISEKRKLLLKGALLYLACSLSLFILSFSFQHALLNNKSTLLIIYLLIFFTGVFRSFTGPSFGTMVGLIVPIEKLENASTWNQGIWLSASVLGHAVVGFLIVGLGNTGTLAIISIMVCLGILFLLQLKPKLPLTQTGDKKTWESVKEGLRFVFQTKILLGALTLDLFAVLFGGAVAMIPVFAKDILAVGPIGFGWLNAAADIGAILVILYLAFYPLRTHQGKTLLLTVAGFGLCIILFGLSKWYFLSFLALLGSGILDGISMVIRGTIIQLKTPNHMRGRVMSVNSMFINSSNELGQFESGLAAKMLGVVPSVVFGGLMTVLIVATTWIKFPSLRKMKY